MEFAGGHVPAHDLSVAGRRMGSNRDCSAGGDHAAECASNAAALMPTAAVEDAPRF